MDSFYRCIRTHVPTAAVNKVSLAVFCGRRKDDSLNYNVFGNEVKQEVEKLLGTEVRVELRQITKNNGIILDGICILEKGCNVSPTIYLEEFYREYKNGMSLREIASRICEVYEKRCRGIPFSLEYFLDFEKMKERIFCKLINWELNKELLNEVPNIPAWILPSYSSARWRMKNLETAVFWSGRNTGSSGEFPRNFSMNMRGKIPFV